MSLMSLLVKLGLDAKEFSTGLEGAVEHTDRAGSSIANSLTKIGGGIVTGGIAAVGAGVVALGGYLTQSVQAASDADEIQAQLGAVLKSTGGAAGVTADMVNDLGTKYGNLTKFEDDAIVSGQNMLLTFTKIGKTTFPGATEAMLNMSQAMGTDLKTTAMQLGKALNDPIQGMTALTRSGVTFTDEQKKVIKRLQETGDMAGAQKIILDELQTEFGGSAVAAGKTFAGKLVILKNKLGNVQETIGNALLPGLTKLAEVFLDWVDDPRIQDGITSIAEGISKLAQDIIAQIPTVLSWFQKIGNWFQNNQGVIVAILAVIGVTLAAFAVSAIASIVSVIIAAAPLLLVIGIIALAAYLLYQAWTTNFGGIQQIVGDLWIQLQPVFQQIKTWLEVNIPIALQILSDFWTNTLLPAIQQVWMWIQAVVFPLIGQLIAWLAVNIPIALQALSDFWTNTLLPAIQEVWNWVQTVAFPIIQKLINWLATNIPIALKALSDFWTKTLLPAIESVWAWLQANLFPLLESLVTLIGTTLSVVVTAMAGFWQNVLLPALKDVGEWLGEKLLPIIKKVGDWISSNFTPAVEGIGNAFAGVKRWIDDAIAALRNIKLPKWLTPGSPTPFEIGLVGIGDALKQLSTVSIPVFAAGIDSNLSESPSLTSNFAGSPGFSGGDGSNAEMISLLRDLRDKPALDEYRLAHLLRDAMLQVVQ